MIERHVFPTVPVTVVYELSQKGRDFRQILIEMREWGERWEK